MVAMKVACASVKCVSLKVCSKNIAKYVTVDIKLNTKLSSYTKMWCVKQMCIIDKIIIMNH